MIYVAVETVESEPLFSAGDIIAIAVAVIIQLVTLVGIYLAARTARASRVRDRRIDAYIRAFDVATQITIQADQSVYFPGSTIEADPERDRERRAHIEIELMGSREARNAYSEWRQAVLPFWMLVHTAVTARYRADKLVDTEEGRIEDGPYGQSRWSVAQDEAEHRRLELIDPYANIKDKFDALEETLRREAQSTRLGRR